MDGRTSRQPDKAHFVAMWAWLALVGMICVINALKLRPLASSLRAASFSTGAGGATSPVAEEDDHYMRLALRHAQLAYRQKEVPIGAVVVDNDKGMVLSTARNSVEKRVDGTAHAEMLAIQKAVQVNENWRLSNCTLYTTLEPCPMCMGAIQASRVKRVVYGTKDPRMGACGSWIDLVHENKHPFHQVEVTSGVCEFECSDILKRFFRWRRKENADRKLTERGYIISIGEEDSSE